MTHLNSRSPSEPTERNDCFTLPNRNITVISPYQSSLEITKDNHLSSAYLDRYPAATLWSNASLDESVMSVAPGCRLEPLSITFLSTVLNTSKSLLGAGIVALPMIFSEASLIPGVIIFTLAIVFSSCSFWIIGYLSHKTTHKSWGGMWKSILSHSNWKVLPNWFKTGAPIDAMIIIANVCNGCSYTLISTANVVNVCQDWLQLPIPAQPPTNDWPPSQWEIENSVSLERRQYATVLLTFCFIIPLNFVNLRQVSCVSVLGILATALLVCVVTFCGPNITQSGAEYELWNPTLQTIGCFAQFSIACCAHSIAPNFYQALEGRHPKKFAKTTAYGYAMILVMNMIVAVCGYVKFGRKIQGQANILEAFSSRHLSATDALMINMARICISLSVLVNHSFQSRAFSTAVGDIGPDWLLNHAFCRSQSVDSPNPVRNKLNKGNIKIVKIMSRSSITTNGTHSPKFTHDRRRQSVTPQHNERGQLIIRIVYTFIVLLISLCIKRLKILFKLAAPLISSSLVYTIPGTMLLMMGTLYKPKDESKRWKLALMVIFGAVFILIGLSCAIFGLYTFIMYTQ